MGSIRRLGAAGAAVVTMGVMPSLVTASAPVQTALPASVAAPATAVVPVEPFRILDTRAGAGTGGSTTPVMGGEVIVLQVAGVGTVPADAVGVVLNVTGTQTTDATFITAWPTGLPRPDASVLNLTPGIDAPNMVTALLGAGQLSLYNHTGSTHLVADVAGYLVASSGGTPGPTGPVGPAGPQGPRGPAGVSGAVNTNGTGTVLNGNVSGTGIANCPVGMRVLGGGAGGGGAGDPSLRLYDSSPNSTSGWQATYLRSGTTGTVTFNVYAICARVES
jgi:hypothetical protein